jgi:hypothetical protein
MARKKTSIEIDELTPDGQWKFRCNGFKTNDEAKEWIDENIKEGERLRISRVSGVFELKRTVTQR